MTTAIAQNATAGILDHVAAVIEGTTGNGVPGTHSADEALNDGSPSNLSITATGATGKTTIAYSSGSYAADRWVKTVGPGYWLLCYEATDSRNVGAARKISAWTQSSTEFTTAAFPQNLAAGDKFYVLQGFKRLPDGLDIEDSQLAGHDRFFHVSATTEESTGFYGAGMRTYMGVLSIRLRLLKYARLQHSTAAAFENARIIVDAVTKRTNWESSYVRYMNADAAETDIDQDESRTIVTINIPFAYRVETTYR